MAIYQSHTPESTVLYQTIARVWPALSMEYAASETPISNHTETEFERYLRCGIQQYGFVRLKCMSFCAKERWQEKTRFILFLTLGLCLAYSFSERRPTRDIVKNLRAGPSNDAPLRALPAEAKVIASAGAIPHLLQISQIRRTNFVGLGHSDFDFIVTKSDEADELPQNLLNASKPCHHDYWEIRCK